MALWWHLVALPCVFSGTLVALSGTKTLPLKNVECFNVFNKDIQTYLKQIEILSNTLKLDFQKVANWQG